MWKEIELLSYCEQQKRFVDVTQVIQIFAKVLTRVDWQWGGHEWKFLMSQFPYFLNILKLSQSYCLSFTYSARILIHVAIVFMCC